MPAGGDAVFTAFRRTDQTLRAVDPICEYTSIKILIPVIQAGGQFQNSLADKPFNAFLFSFIQLRVADIYLVNSIVQNKICICIQRRYIPVCLQCRESFVQRTAFRSGSGDKCQYFKSVTMQNTAKAARAKNDLYKKLRFFS